MYNFLKPSGQELGLNKGGYLEEWIMVPGLCFVHSNGPISIRMITFTIIKDWRRVFKYKTVKIWTKTRAGFSLQEVAGLGLDQMKNNEISNLLKTVLKFRSFVTKPF